MDDTGFLEAEIARGAERASELLGKQRRNLQEGGVPAPGILVAEGDSWLDYPRTDLLTVLEDSFGWDVHSVAHRGDNLESMAYDTNQLTALIRTFRGVSKRDKTPDALLLSGGGNDFAGPELAMLLDHVGTDHGGINETIVAELVEVRMAEAWANLLGFSRQVAIELFGAPVRTVVHGYDYAVPDGRGFGWLSGFGPFPGPWLAPSYARKGIGSQTPDGLVERFRLTRDLIDRYNMMLEAVSNHPGLDHVRYVDLRGTLKGPPDHEEDWANEMHPTSPGFLAIATKLNQELIGASN